VFQPARTDHPLPRICAATAVLAAVVAAASTGCSKPQGSEPATPSRAVITSTTQIAGAGVLGNQRRPDESCGPEPAAPDPAPGPTRRVDAGADQPGPDRDIDVPADPQRIVVLAGDQLDALCALGLQGRIVAAALPVGSDRQPSYLGTVIHDLPAAGSAASVDLGAVGAAKPDLILGTGDQSYGQLSGIAPTVFTGSGGAGWRDHLRAVGAATGRADAAAGLVAQFDGAAEKAGQSNDAAHFQASVVQLTEDSLRVFGADTFPGSVMAAVGVERPAAQRFTDKPFLEIGAADGDLADADFGAADGDIVYLSFSSPAARERAHAVLESPAWLRLSATRDNRVFVVNNEVWQTGQGVVAARGIIDDLRLLNAPIN
jgi:iron complex transport system substrate-binding protein